MLKGTNNQKLIDEGLKEKHLLFYQLWKELTESKTFDTYQYKSTNVLNGIRELIHDVEAYLEGTVSSTHTINAMCEELLFLVNQDVVIASAFPTLRNRLVPNLSKKSESSSQLKGLLYQLNYFYSELARNYDSELTKKLAEAIDEESNTQCVLTSQFISRCVDLGWSVKSLSSKVDVLKNEQAKANSILDFLSKIINAKKQSYKIFSPFRLKISIKDGKTKEESRTAVIQQLSTFGINVKTGLQIKACCTSIIQTELTDDQLYMIVKTNAYDVFSAAHLSVISLSRVLNILSFFTTIESWSVSDISLVVYNEDSPYVKSIKASDVYKTYEYLDSSSKVYRRAANIISQNDCNHALSQKLLSSFTYANLSRASMALEEKYMNIWIAIESLCRSDVHKNIIDSILTLVPNALCLRYVYRIVRNFVEDCIRCNVDFEFSTKSIDLRMDNKDCLMIDTISVFRDKALQSELEVKCMCNSLLHQRFNEMVNILTNPQTLITKVQRHHTTVKWHLNRLYRIRNEIAHSGMLQEISAVRYTEHLYDYLATLVSEITRFSESKSTNCLGEIFSSINDNYLEFCDLSSSKKAIDKSLVLGKLWTSGVIDFL